MIAEGGRGGVFRRVVAVDRSDMDGVPVVRYSMAAQPRDIERPLGDPLGQWRWPCTRRYRRICHTATNGQDDDGLGTCTGRARAAVR